MPVSNINKFQEIIQHISAVEIDLKYNPLYIGPNNLKYFDLHTAHYLSRKWLQEQTELINKTPRIFYRALVKIHIKITKLINHKS